MCECFGGEGGRHGVGGLRCVLSVWGGGGHGVGGLRCVLCVWGGGGHGVGGLRCECVGGGI